VVYTDFRPTPLQHYLFPAGADALYMVVDERSRFREDNFQKAVAALTEGAEGAANGKGKGGGKGARLHCPCPGNWQISTTRAYGARPAFFERVEELKGAESSRLKISSSAVARGSLAMF